jgi:hypothetical protein
MVIPPARPSLLERTAIGNDQILKEDRATSWIGSIINHLHDLALTLPIQNDGRSLALPGS